MSNLTSILNSGESLEKTAILIKLAMDSNPSFYSQYEKIIVFYCENLPKQEKELEIHGTLGGAIKNLKNKNYLKYKSLGEIWEDRDTILNKIYCMGRISPRIKDSLMKDRGRFDKVISNFPWYEILDDFKKLLMKEFINRPRIVLEFFDFKTFLEKILGTGNQQHHSKTKAQILNPDGSISSLTFLNGLDNKRKLDLTNKGIVLSPNVFMFISGMYHFQKVIDKDPLFGFRKFDRLVSPKRIFNRNLDERFLVSQKESSYSLAIDFLKEQENVQMIIEPKNVLFNQLLSGIDIKQGPLSSERKTTLAIYNYLNKIL